MLIIAAHCDTIMKIMDTESDLYKNSYHLDLERILKSRHPHIQFFAVFIDHKYFKNAKNRAIQAVNYFAEQIKNNKEYIIHCKNMIDIHNTINNFKIGAVLTIEGGEALNGDIFMLKYFYDLGVRSICLTWNNDNELAFSITSDDKHIGLKPFGKTVIKEMNDIGMIIDVSHISEKSFWDVLELTSKPIIASHSNARMLCSHSRNLTDDQLNALKQNNGVVGINLCPYFLNTSGQADLSDIISHIEYIISRTSPDNIGLGSDFDGIAYLPKSINGVQDLDCIFNELSKLNYSDSLIKKLAGENLLRIINSCLIL